MYSIPSLALLALLLFLLARGAVSIIGKQLDSSDLAEAEAMKAEELLVRKAELEDKVERLKTEEGVKEEIRERFNVTAGSEHVAIIVENNQATTTGEEEKKPWYKRVWNAIMGGN